jgi:hypothetical protein
MNTQTIHAPVLVIDGETIPVIPDPDHEYTLPTADVARGYGVSPTTIRRHKETHGDELLEGKHFSSVQNMNAGNLKRLSTRWTKRGIVRLGFFIRSERAKRFRDMAEDLVLRHLDPQPVPEPEALGSVAEILRRKFDAFEVGRHGTLEDLRQFAELCAQYPLDRDTAPADPRWQPGPLDQFPPDALEQPLAHWLAWFAIDLSATRTPRVEYTLRQLLQLAPPLPGRFSDPAKALGRRLGRLSRHPIPYAPGRSAHLYSRRDHRHRYWVIDIGRQVA